MRKDLLERVVNYMSDGADAADLSYKIRVGDGLL
jgi:hypothetical protein